jgi:hypothetical protein
MTDHLALNIDVLRKGLDDHNGKCPEPATAFLLNQFDRDRLGVNELWGLEVRADERVPVMRFRLLCSASAWQIEQELELYILEARPVPAVR